MPVEKQAANKLASALVPNVLPFTPTKPPDDPVVIGSVIKPVGLAGHVRVGFVSGNPERLQGIRYVVIRLDDQYFTVKVASSTPELTTAKVRFREASNMDEAELLRGAELVVSRSESPPLPEGEYYSDQLDGCKVILESGEELGRIKEVYNFGHHDVLVVVDGEHETLIPTVSEFIAEVDTSAKIVKVKRDRSFWEGA